jgi:hypothetical protein
MHWLDNADQKQALFSAVGDEQCLPPNPRRIKALANQWSRFAACVPFPTNIVDQKNWAIRVLISAYIHQFHRDLWERWHYTPDFWVEIQAWCNGERMTPRPEWAKSLKLTFDEASPDNMDLRKSFPNPGDVDNFWVGILVRKYSDHLNPRDFYPLLIAPEVNNGQI